MAEGKCKACGSKKTLIHKSNILGEELCWSCFEHGLSVEAAHHKKKHLENSLREASNPRFGSHSQSALGE